MYGNSATGIVDHEAELEGIGNQRNQNAGNSSYNDGCGGFQEWGSRAACD